MTDQSRTPRTNKFVDGLQARRASGPINSAADLADFVDFARTLELEAADLRERLAKAERDANDWRQHREIMQMSGIEGVVLVRLTIRKNGEVHNYEQALSEAASTEIGRCATMMLSVLNAHIDSRALSQKGADHE